MLARAAARSARPLSRAFATSATPANKAPVELAAVSGGSPNPLVSHGELAWCEVYGVDYDQQIMEAEMEGPIALNDRASVRKLHDNSSANPRAATPQAAQQDIWTVVFGSAR
ncbi:hypothetical protein ATCC90586_003702 [Pythium insidiosum]|nr:hypothetical protein ATCC90586_003702 [Pythium insidiosum]